MKAVMNAILYGIPELFFIEQNIEMNYNGTILHFNVNNKYDGNISGLWDELNNEVNRIVEIIDKKETDYEKIERLNQYLCLRVKPSSSTAEKTADAYGALILKSARCEGFSKAAKLILDRLGIENHIVIGEACLDKRVPHAWIKAKVNDDYFNFDFSWNASKTLHEIPSLEYLFLEDELISIDHFTDYNYPVCNNPNEKYWVKNNCILNRRSDLSKMKIVSFKRSYFSIVKINWKISDYEYRYELLYWLEENINPSSYGNSVDYIYNEKLDLVVFYFLN